MEKIFLTDAEQKKEDALYTIVEYDEDYFDYFFNLHKDSFKEYFEKHYGKWSDTRQRKSFENMMSSGNYKMILHNNEIVGLINLQYPQEEITQFGGTALTPAVLRYLCIDKKWRNKGIGVAILRKISRELHYKKISLKVYTDNQLAVKLYSRFGFLIDPKNSDEHYITMTRGIDRNIVFRKMDDKKYRKEHGISIEG